jgi:hypothetical protein
MVFSVILSLLDVDGNVIGGGGGAGSRPDRPLSCFDIEILCGVSFQLPSTTLPQAHHRYDGTQHNDSLARIYAANRASFCGPE